MVDRKAQARCRLAGNCVRCLHGVGHPPLLAVFDRGTGTYVRAEGQTCMARWASTGGGLGEGDICGAPADKTVAGIDLCQHHADRLSKWRYFEEPEERVRAKTESLRAADLEYERAEAESELRREKIRAARSVVYYIRRESDGAVKIGTTTQLRNRMSALRAEHGELRVLLTHSGTMKEEREMHRQFAHYRLGRTEWFAPVKELLQWIAGRRGWHGEVQPRSWVSQRDLRKLITAAPAARSLERGGGAVRWPPREAA